MKKLILLFFIGIILISGCVGEEVSEQVDEDLNVKCNWAVLDTNQETFEDGTLTFILENTGVSDIEIQKIQILYNDGTQEDAEFTSMILESNTFIEISLSNINSNIETVKVITECPELTIEIIGSEISGV